MIVVKGAVLSVEPTPSGACKRVVIADKGRTNHLLMVGPTDPIKVGESVERECRVAIERRQDGRVTGFITLWDAGYQPVRKPRAEGAA